MARLTAAWLVVAVALAAPARGIAGMGVVDRERRVLRCTGTAAPTLREESENVTVTRVRTERAARQDALRSCLDALKPLPAGAGETVGGRLARDPALASAVQSLLERSIAAAEQRFFSDGGVSVESSTALDSELSELLPVAFPPRGS